MLQPNPVDLLGIIGDCQSAIDQRQHELDVYDEVKPKPKELPCVYRANLVNEIKRWKSCLDDCKKLLVALIGKQATEQLEIIQEALKEIEALEGKKGETNGKKYFRNWGRNSGKCDY